MPTDLTTETLLLRPLTADDRALSDALYGDERVTSGFGLPAYTPAQLDTKIDQLLGEWAQNGYSQFAVIDRASGQPTGLGGVRPTATAGVGEIGYVFLPDRWGQGITSGAIGVWTDWAFNELGLTRIVADGVESAASIRALTKNGYLPYEETGSNGHHLVSLDLSRKRWAAPVAPSQES